MDYNHICIVGYLGGDAESRVTANGNVVTNLRVATGAGTGDKKRTDWHKVVCWGKTAEIAGKWATKGRRVLIEGTQHHDAYVDERGIRRYKSYITATKLLFFDKAGDPQETGDAEEPYDVQLEPLSLGD